MTNFEKWKENLTVDDIIALAMDNCDNCPAYCGYCKEIIAFDCANEIRDWANKEVAD